MHNYNQEARKTDMIDFVSVFLYTIICVIQDEYNDGGNVFTLNIIMSEKLYVVMPAYNEESNIGAVIEEWYAVLEGKSKDSRLVIADKGSTDGTHDVIMEKIKNGYSKLEVIDTNSQFHGPKVIALYDYAIKNGADFVFQTDSDGQTSASEFDHFWNYRNDFDGIFGHRTVRGDGKDRAFVEKVVCLLVRFYFGVDIPDANAPFRLMRTDVLKKYLYRMSSDYNLPNIMVTTFFKKYGERVCFEPITFKPRTAGKNSINIPRIVKIGWNALSDFSAFKKGMKEINV